MQRHQAFFRLLLVGLLLAPGGLLAGHADAATYSQLVEQAQDGEDVNWQALRFAYADSPEFDLMGVTLMLSLAPMNKAMQEKDFAEAARLAELVLERTYVSLDAHLVCAAAYAELGEKARSERHKAIAQGIFNSIATGDGTTPEKAFTVIAVWEEYSVLRALGLQPQGQSLLNENGHSYDVLTAVNPHGKSFLIHFQVDRVLAAEKALIGKATQKP